MADSFDSPKSLLRHAGEDFEELKTILKKVLREHTHEEVFDRDPETGHKRQKIVFAASIPSRARYSTNNILNNTRHALDQALSAAVEVLVGKRSRDLYFPFCNSPADLEGRLKSERYEIVPPELHPVIRSFQPYPSGAGHTGGNDFLCAIAQIVGPNKHQTTLSANLDIGPEFIAEHIFYEAIYNAVLPPKWDMEKGEMILGTMPDDAKIHYDFKVIFHIAFGDAGPMYRHPVIPALHRFLSEAAHIVQAFERETARIQNV